MKITWEIGEGETLAYPNIIAVYALFDPIDGKMRYVGQTRDPAQRYRAHLKVSGSQCNPAKARWIAMLLQQGVEPEMVIFGVVPKDRARDIEMLLIGANVRDGLLNRVVPTPEEHRQRAARLGCHE